MNKLFITTLFFFLPVFGCESAAFCSLYVSADLPYHIRKDRENFWAAVSQGDSTKLKEFSYISLNTPAKNGEYPIHVTLKNGHLASALQLVKMGADTSKIGQSGLSAIDLAQVKFGRTAAFSLLALDCNKTRPEPFFALLDFSL